LTNKAKKQEEASYSINESEFKDSLKKSSISTTFKEKGC